MTDTQSIEIAILGALDRYNYGDLLFPLILRHYLKTKGTNAIISCYGLIGADYEQVGSVRVRPFHEFYRRYLEDTKSKNVIIIAGGRVMAPRAGTLYSFIRSTPLLNVIGLAAQVFHLPNPADRIAQRKLQITWGDFPFCPTRPNQKTLLIYNAVGGNARLVPQLLPAVSQADSISIRNPALFTRLKEELSEKNVMLCPDSAAVMSRLWPLNWLRDRMSPQVAAILKDYPDGYIVVQLKNKYQRCLTQIAHELNQLCHQSRLPLVLVPLGRAARHEDQVLLQSLARQLTVPSQFAQSTHIHDIMGLIAHADLFIGTSLHGNITAMSYARPHLGIGSIPKLDQYIKYWDVEPNKSTGTVKPNQICSAAIHVLEKTDKGQLQQNAEQLSQLSHEDLIRIAERVQQYITD